ncbi:GNAT family N-acetyltransferase [Roseiterribacter gracilis]|uniref:N-acetyltransferase n=1 Tax=Roseiterribacter gracilis TaxID=2812848 RepID=A0A8S8XFZ6_9PROT|nr:N-acetyltransferase [Rhodospirillales bacterium TMPK1]
MKFAWRPLQQTDLPQVDEIAARVHPDLPEDPSVLAEKLALYPSGCFAFAWGEKLNGYLFSHPWRGVPKLNTKLVVIPVDADAYYIHDLALLPGARGMQAGTQIVQHLATTKHAEGFPRMALVAVYNSVPFWKRQGFQLTDRIITGYGGKAHYMLRELI